MTIFRLLLCLLFLLNASIASAQVVKAGEKIYYNVTQLGIKAGEATLTFVGEQTYEDQKVLLIIFKAEGLAFKDEEKIYLDPKDYKPIAVDRDLDIPGHKEKIHEQYLKDSIKITKISGGETTEQTIDKPGGTDNIYAFIYRYRQSGTFKKKDRFDVHLPTTNVTIKMVKETKLAAGGTKYKAFYMESVPSKYKLWFDASEKKLPLRISGSMGPGNTVMVMTKYEN